MGKKSKVKRQSKIFPEVTHAIRVSPNWSLLVLSSLGIVLTGYLAWSAYSGGPVKGCSAGGGCDVVLSSRWSSLFGLPTALWGLLAYAGLAGIAFVRRVDKHWSYAWTAAFGVCYSVYLTIVSLTILKSACPYCLTSLGLMTSILVLVAKQRPVEMANRSWRGLIVARGTLAAVFIFLLHLNYTTPLPEPPAPENASARALAEHLTERGVKFYGASWCPHCQEQKRLFGSSAHRLPYIECSPGGRTAPAAAACQSQRIATYPTWVIGGRLFTEVLSLKQLADETGFVAEASFK